VEKQTAGVQIAMAMDINGLAITVFMMYQEQGLILVMALGADI